MEKKKTKLVDNILKAIKIRSKITGISISQPNLRDIERDLCDFDVIFKDSDKLGSGSCGIVLKVYIDDDSDNIFPMAIKETESKYIKSKVLINEQEILKRLYMDIVKTDISPHLPIYICSYSCDPDIKYNREATSFMIIMDLMDGGTLRNVLNDDKTTSHEMDVYFFQLLLLFYALKRTFPYFSHNDIFEENVFFRKCISEGYTFYDYGEDLKFYLPNIGLQLVLGDFGISTLISDDVRDNDLTSIIDMFISRNNGKKFGEFYSSFERVNRPYIETIKDKQFSKFKTPQLDIKMAFSF